MIAEKAVLSRIIFSDEWAQVMDRRTTAEIFQDAECKQCFRFIDSFYQKYGAVPSLDLIEEEFEDLKLTYAKEPVEYYLDKVTENYIRVKGSASVMRSAKSIMETPLKGLESLQTTLSELTMEAVPTKDDDLEETTDDRKARYTRLKTVGGMDGYPTPWEPLNEATMGLHAGDFLAIVARPGVGKAQSLDSTLWTADGAIRMGDVQVGTQIFGQDGQLCKVTGVHPQGEKMSYRVTFSDGSSTESCLEHLWAVTDDDGKTETLMLKTILQRVAAGASLSDFSIPMTKPVQFNEKHEVTNGFELGREMGKADEMTLTSKDVYSSVSSRLDILEGFFTERGKRLMGGSILVHTDSLEVADYVQFAVESLGGTVKDDDDGYDTLSLVVDLPYEKHEPFRRLHKVEPVGLKPMQCISVDAEDSLYLTDHFIVTHNTFLLTKFAEFSARQGLKVLLVSGEMSNTQIMQRFDAMYFKLPYKELRAGLLPDVMEQRYFDGLDNMDGVSVVVTQDVNGVNSVGTKIDQYQPDVVLLDGMYLLADDEKSNNKWESISNVSRNLKKLAKRKKVPIIATTQFNRGAEDVAIDKVTLSSLGFSDSIGQDADVVLGMFRTKDMELNNEMRVRSLKVREGEPKDFTLGWDLHRMEFDVLSVGDEDSYLNDDLDGDDDDTIAY